MRSALAVVALSLALPASAARSSAPGTAGLTFTRIVRGQAADRESVWVAAADGSHPRRVTANGFDGRLSSDGRWLTFEREQARPDGKYELLFLAGLVTGETRLLGKTTGNERWSPTGAQFAASQPGGLFFVDARSGKRTRLLAAPVSSFDFTPDARSIVLARGSGTEWTPTERSDLFRLHLADGRIERITHDGYSKGPLVSLTGIAYVRFKNRYAAPEVWRIRGDGTGRRLVARCCETRWYWTHPGTDRGFEPVALSVDGKHLLSCQPSEGWCRPVAIDLPSGRRYLFPETTKLGTRNEGATALDLTRDGRTALIVVNPWDDETGPRLLYAVPFAGGTPRLLARGVAFAHWRA